MVDYRESAILRMLVLEKLSADRTAIREAHRNKGPASSTDALSGEVKADAREGFEHRPTAVMGGVARSRSAKGKDRGSVTPAKSTVLRLVVDNSRCLTMANPKRDCPRAAMVKHLVLV